MRRFFRWAVNGLAVASLLLCVATCVLWVRSYSLIDIVVTKTHDGCLWFIHSSGGRILFERVPEWPDEGANWWLTFPLPPDEVGNMYYPVGMSISGYHYAGVTV